MDGQFAASAGYVDDAVEALEGGTVFVSSEVSGGAALANTLEAQIGDASVGVAVFSDNAALEASGPDIVAELAQRTGFDTIIVAVGDDLSAGSRVLQPGEAMLIANEAEGSADSLEAALTETVQGVVVASAEPVAQDGVSGGLVVGLGIAVALAVGAVIAVVAVARSRRGRQSGGKELPPAVRGHVQTLRSLSVEYAAVGASGNATAAAMAQELDVIAENVSELFTRLGRKGSEDQRGLAGVEYGDKLRKLTAAVGREYLLDILTHPRLWDDPDDRVREVRDATVAVSNELVDNIKQVNARRALHFQVSLDTLIGRRKELQDWEREFRQASPPAAIEGDAAT